MSAGAKHKQLMAARPAPLRHAAAAFPLTFRFRLDAERLYPRAGVRRRPDGKWLRLLWYGPALVRVDPEPLTHETRRAAVKAAQEDVHAARARFHPAGQVHLRGVGRNNHP